MPHSYVSGTLATSLDSLVPLLSLTLNNSRTPLRTEIHAVESQPGPQSRPAVSVFIAYWSPTWSQSSFYKPFSTLLVPRALNLLPVTTSLRLMQLSENNQLSQFSSMLKNLKIFVHLLLFFYFWEVFLPPCFWFPYGSCCFNFTSLY